MLGAAPNFLAHPLPSMAVACPDCRARVGTWCKRPSGHKAMGMHNRRHEEADRQWLLHDLPTITHRRDGTYIYDGPETRPSVTSKEAPVAKIGIKEQQLRDLRARPRHHQMMAEDVLPDKFLRTGSGPKPKREKKDAGVALAPPISVQKAIAADLADDDKTTTVQAIAKAEPQEDTMSKNRKTKTPAKGRQKAKGAAKKTRATKSRKKTAAPRTTAGADGAPKENNTTRLTAFLKEPGGKVSADIEKKFGWLPHTARAAVSRLGSNVYNSQLYT